MVQGSRSKVISSYLRYLAVASAVGIATVALREIFAWLLPQTSGQYALTMVLAYVIGTILNYVGQGRFTFDASGHRPGLLGWARFACIASLSALFTILIAYVLRFGTGLEAALPAAAPSLAFAGAALLASGIAYPLQRQLVFGKLPSGQPSRQYFSRSTVWPFAVGAVALLVQAAWFGHMALYYNAANPFDQTWFVRMAGNLAGGRWLGVYDHMTLIKGIGFPVWIAICHLLGLPFAIATAALYGIACVLAVLAIRPVLPSPMWLLALFLLLLFNPVFLAANTMLRELIYPSLTLLVVAGAIGVGLRWRAADGQLTPWLWAAMLGFALAAFWMTREEHIWITPLILLFPLAMCAERQEKTGARNWRTPVALAMLAVCCWTLPLLSVASVNRYHYGVFSLVEVNERPFISAYGALARVDRDTWSPFVPVPRENWPRIAAVSAEFVPVAENLEKSRWWLGGRRGVGYLASVSGAYNSSPEMRSYISLIFNMPLPATWAEASVAIGNRARTDAGFRDYLFADYDPALAEVFISNTDGGGDEIEGGWFLWALRDAAATAGFYRTAEDAARHYRQLADEINGACASGRLRCHPERNTLAPILDQRYLKPFFVALRRAVKQVATLPYFGPVLSPSDGPAAEVRRGAGFSAHPPAPPILRHFRLLAYPFAKVLD